ncbi:MAG: radical SAM protein, partial [Myxococcota bacterium]
GIPSRQNTHRLLQALPMLISTFRRESRSLLGSWLVGRLRRLRPDPLDRPPPADPCEAVMEEDRPTNQLPNKLRDSRRNVEINIGKACNNRCVFCLDGMPKKEDRSYMPFDDMKAEIERWYASGHRSMGFLGGEPTTYPKIVQSVAYAREIGFTRIAIATNATKLRLTHFTDRLLDAGLTRITISMHGHTASLEDRLTRVPGNFEKKCTAIRYLNQKRADGHLPDGLSVNIVLNGWNYRYLPKMLRFFYETMGLDDVRVNFVRPEGYAVGSKSLTPKYTKVVPILMKAIVLNEYHFKKTFTFGGFPLCVLPTELTRSETLLKKYMGEYRDLSTDCSIRHDGVSEGVAVQEGGRARFNWQDRKRHDLKGHPDACTGCARFSLCEGVWQGYLDIWGQDEFKTIR